MSSALRFATTRPGPPRRVLPKRRIWLWLYANRPRSSRGSLRASRKPGIWHKGRPLRLIASRLEVAPTRRTRRVAPKFRT